MRERKRQGTTERKCHKGREKEKGKVHRDGEVGVGGGMCFMEKLSVTEPLLFHVLYYAICGKWTRLELRLRTSAMDFKSPNNSTAGVPSLMSSPPTWPIFPGSSSPERRQPTAASPPLHPPSPRLYFLHCLPHSLLPTPPPPTLPNSVTPMWQFLWTEIFLTGKAQIRNKRENTTTTLLDIKKIMVTARNSTALMT